MKLAKLVLIPSVVSLGSATLGVSRLEAQRPAVHQADVVLDEKCQIKGSVKDLNDDVGRADTVRWVFKNGCSEKLTLSIGNFQPVAGKGPANECRDKNPLDQCRLRVNVGPGRSGTIQCRVKPAAHFPRTYKYDILRNGKVALDPEIEIEK